MSFYKKAKKNKTAPIYRAAEKKMCIYVFILRRLPVHKPLQPPVLLRYT